MLAFRVALWGLGWVCSRLLPNRNRDIDCVLKMFPELLRGGCQLERVGRKSWATINILAIWDRELRFHWMPGRGPVAVE